MNISRTFITAAKGREKHPGAIFTLEVSPEFIKKHSDVHNHYTYKVKYKVDPKFGEKWFVNLLTGSDNNSSYSYIGLLNADNGEFITTPGSKAGDAAWSVRLIKRVFACMWESDGASLEDLTDNGFDLHHEERCGRCGKKLSTPRSCTLGLGPICESFM